MNKKKIVDALNQALSQEYASYIRYATYASFIKGLNSEPIRERFKEMAEDERQHAEKIRERIAALGGLPTTKVESSQVPTELAAILKTSLDEEKKAVTRYMQILKNVRHDQDLILYEVLEDVIEDDQEHVEEIARLLGE